MSRLEHADFSLIAPGEPVLLMVSGGADSVALLRSVLEAQTEGLIAPSSIHVLHVNHGIRGESATHDELFVQDLCAALSVNFTCKSFDIPALAIEQKTNEENAGRIARYDAARSLLQTLCAQDGCPNPEAQGSIATAHTLDDRVETFYMRSIVGTGPSGLASIPRKNGQVVRPLLSCTRAEIEHYLVALNQPYCTDETNADTTYFRAFVRHNMVPLASEANPTFRRNLERTMNLIEEDAAYFEALTAEASSQCISRDIEGSLVLDASAFYALPSPVQKRVLTQLMREYLGPDVRLDGAHIDKILHDGAQPGFSITLAKNRRVYEEQGALVFLTATPIHKPQWCGTKIDPANTPQTVAVAPFGEVTFRALTGKEARSLLATKERAPLDSQSPIAVYLALDPAQGPLQLDVARIGDVCKPFGMNGHTKKLSDLLSEAKVPRRLRTILPLLRTANGDIAWVWSFPPAETMRVTAQTVCVLEVTRREVNK